MVQCLTRQIDRIIGTDVLPNWAEETELLKHSAVVSIYRLRVFTSRTLTLVSSVLFLHPCVISLRLRSAGQLLFLHLSTHLRESPYSSPAPINNLVFPLFELFQGPHFSN